MADAVLRSAKELYRAAKRGDPQAVLGIVGMAPNAVTFWDDEDGMLPIHVGCAVGSKEIVRSLLKAGSPVNEHARKGKRSTPLFLAAEGGYRDIVEILIKAGAEVNKGNAMPTEVGKEEGAFMTPLAAACKGGKLAEAALLIKAGADVNAKDAFGNTPLMAAAENGNEDLVSLLLEANAQLEVMNANGKNALYIACEAGRGKAVEAMLKFGPDVNKGNAAFTATPLLIACYNGHSDIVEMLINAKADVNACMKDRVSSLFVASETDRLSIVEMLIRAGADPEISKETTGNTPLLIAAQNGHVDVVKMLVTSGCKLTTTNLVGASALVLACKNNHPRIVETLLAGQHSSELTPLVSIGTLDGLAPLLLAAQNGNKEICMLLLNKGADCGAKTPLGQSAWDLARDNGHTELADILEKAFAAQHPVWTKTTRGMHGREGSKSSLTLGTTRVSSPPAPTSAPPPQNP